MQHDIKSTKNSLLNIQTSRLLLIGRHSTVNFQFPAAVKSFSPETGKYRPREFGKTRRRWQRMYILRFIFWNQTKHHWRVIMNYGFSFCSSIFQTHSHSLLCWSLTLPILMFFGLGWSLSVPLISSLKNVSNFLRLSPTTVPATPHTKENRKRPWIQLEIYKIGLTSVTKTEQKRTTLLLYCCLVPVIALIILAELVFRWWRTLIGCWEGREKGVLPSRALWEGNTLFSGPVRFGGEISKLI